MRRIAAVIALGVFGLALVACGPDKPAPAEAPGPVRLDTPRAAVGSYLERVSYAYRISDAEPATPTMTPEELVRVAAYIERNRQENRGIEQSLESFESRNVRSGESTALLAATESWNYRYFSLRPLEYSSEPLEASYDTTYTLVRTPEGWLVHDIEVRAASEVE